MKRILTILSFLSVLLTLSAQDMSKIRAQRNEIREMEKQQFVKQTQLMKGYPNENQKQFDIKSYTIDIEIQNTQKKITGSGYISGVSLVNNLSHVEIDLYDVMTVTGVFQNELPVAFTHNNGIINVELTNPLNAGEEFTIKVDYGGKPQNFNNKAFTWNTHGNNKPIISTLSEPFGAPAWWPCKDDPSDKADSVFINVLVPDDLVVASNGLLKEVETVDSGKKRYKWETHYPVSTYLVSIAVSNYTYFNDWYVSAKGDSMEMAYYVYPELLTNAQKDFAITKDMVGFFASKFGEYPFIKEKYGNALFPFGGGMEHQTLCSYGSSLITGANTFDWLNAHETAHQWFGDCIAVKSWPHVWMKEGFASYAEALWFESIGGTQAYKDWMQVQYQDQFPGSLFVYDSTDAEALFSNTVYDKGAWVLHMLRGVLGDDVFFNCIKSYATDPRFLHNSANTEDFQSLCENISGQDLDWFFSEWVYRPGRPSYVFNWRTEGTGPFTTTVNILQQNEILYKMPIQIRLSGAGIDTTITVMNELADQSYQFVTDFNPTEVIFDPDNWVLKTLLESEIYSLKGRVLDAAGANPVTDAQIVWEGPYDPYLGFPMRTGNLTTDVNGEFELQKPSGLYSIYAMKDGYVMSGFGTYNISQSINNIEFRLTQPEASYSIDSLYYVLVENTLADTNLTITNTGSGEMYIQIMEGNHLRPMKNIQHRPVLASQFPLKQIQEAPVPLSKDYILTTDEEWILVNSDTIENSDNPFNIENTYVSTNEDEVKIKITTNGAPSPREYFRLNIFIDSDNDITTGQFMRGLGADYIMTIGDFGNGNNGYLIRYSEELQNYELVDFASTYRAYPSLKTMIIGINRTTLGNPSSIGMLIQSFDSRNIFGTLDFVPSDNLGYLSASLTDVPWLNISGLSGKIASGEEFNSAISIDPYGHAVSGIFKSGITVRTTHDAEMDERFIPVNLDYTTDVKDELVNVPDEFVLEQNYPNPFNPVTNIKFGIPKNCFVNISVYNILGEKVGELVNSEMTKGYHKVDFDASDLTSGIYFYSIEADNFKAVKKMMLIK